MKFISAVVFIIFASSISRAQLSPEITSWILNTTDTKGYNDIESNIQQVQYSSDSVYVSATCIPGYDIGPWTNNPNKPTNQNFVYMITRHPEANTGTAIPTPRGHIGVWTNGVSIFNAMDANSYMKAGKWNQNAIVVEGSSFDNCLGHPAPNGEYHHHLNPRCLYDSKDSSKHSPIIGFAFDGFPVYGAYGFSNTDGTGKITRMRTSYRLRNITERTTLPDGTALPSAQYGPAVSAQYPVGFYVEDYEYIKGLGDLDEHNGRFCITPEYPGGIYAYFVTLDSTTTAVFPYVLGTTYYGLIPPGNTGKDGGHNAIYETVTAYTTSGVKESPAAMTYSVFPNPASNVVNIFIDPSSHNNVKLIVRDAEGKTLYSQENLQPAVLYSVDVSRFPSGTYFITLTDGNEVIAKRFIVFR